MHVAITGGTGFIGKAVVSLLLSRGITPRLLLRTSPRQALGQVGAGTGTSTLAQGAEVRIVDFSSQTSIAEACRGAGAIIHLVGIIAELGPNTFHEAHVVLTGRMVQAAQEAGVRRYLQMSALGTRDHARSQYHRTKCAAEGLVRASGLEWTIFRPSLVYSAHGGFAAVFEQMSRFSPFLPAIGGGRSLLQPIALDQVARAFVEALHLPGSVGQTYDLCGPERLQFREVLQGILAALGRRRLILTIPLGVARVQARFLEFVWPRLLRRAPPLSRDQILMLEEDNTGDGTLADATFGLRHVPFRIGMRGSSSH